MPFRYWCFSLLSLLMMLSLSSKAQSLDLNILPSAVQIVHNDHYNFSKSIVPASAFRIGLADIPLSGRKMRAELGYHAYSANIAHSWSSPGGGSSVRTDLWNMAVDGLFYPVVINFNDRLEFDLGLLASFSAMSMEIETTEWTTIDPKSSITKQNNNYSKLMVRPAARFSYYLGSEPGHVNIQYALSAVDGLESFTTLLHSIGVGVKLYKR